MNWGLKNRLSRIINPKTGHAVMLAVDHGYFLGPTSKLEVPSETIKPVDPRSDTPVVLRVSGGTSIVGSSLADEGITTPMEEALRLNVSAVALSIFIGTEHEKQTLLNLSALVTEGERYGIPVLAVTAVGKELEKRDARFLSLCCRIAAELGANFVKTYYCQDFEKVVEGCPVPIVIAGGPKLETFRDTLELTADAIARGAVGVDMGRNIWQSDHPIAAIKAVRAVVHKKASVDEAMDVFERSKARKSQRNR
jgi:putative autoinducer-2 (AI-2) aldolase